MKEIIAGVNATKNAFHFESEYNKARLLEWMKTVKYFRIIPIETENVNVRRFLEAAIIPEYCLFQYGIDPRDMGKDEARRFLFKQDFHYDILSDRNGNPVKAPKSSKGHAKALVDTFTAWATENGCRVPNNALYLMWRDKYKSNDMRFPTFHDFLSFLHLECDAMPSNETLSKLDEEKGKTPEYPEEYNEPKF